jgi:hypothetical protein
MSCKLKKLWTADWWCELIRLDTLCSSTATRLFAAERQIILLRVLRAAAKSLSLCTRRPSWSFRPAGLKQASTEQKHHSGQAQLLVYPIMCPLSSPGPCSQHDDVNIRLCPHRNVRCWASCVDHHVPSLRNVLRNILPSLCVLSEVCMLGDDAMFHA